MLTIADKRPDATLHGQSYSITTVSHNRGTTPHLTYNKQKQTTMFTLSQIKAAHSKVKPAPASPAYIDDLKTLCVIHYETFVADGHTEYNGAGPYSQSTPASPDQLHIVSTTDTDQFKADLPAHQQGRTDYPTFCRYCAKSGIAKWVVSTGKMTCTYLDLTNNALLVESIPD
jgi:uncharacterized protein YbcV (DUF1398 family)